MRSSQPYAGGFLPKGRQRNKAQLLREIPLFRHTSLLRPLSPVMRAFLLVVVLSTSALIATAARTGTHAEYVGGTRVDIPANNSGDINITDQVYFVFVSKRTKVKVPYERINLLEYGQKVDRRYLAAVIISPLFLLAKKREHFLTVGFQDDEGRQQAMVFRVDKNDVRLTLVALEARTGQRIQYQDDEARMAGKG
jgi:hypothetical protein